MFMHDSLQNQIFLTQIPEFFRKVFPHTHSLSSTDLNLSSHIVEQNSLVAKIIASLLGIIL